jgi:phosphoribosylformylglycinamidine synthase
MVNVKVINDCSPWLQGMKDVTYTVPVSHGEGRFYADTKTLKELIQNGQIATQYVDQHGQPTLVFPYNPNGSEWGVEGLISKDGRIFGRMSHPERMKPDRFKNIPTATYQNIFKNGVDYFL